MFRSLRCIALVFISLTSIGSLTRAERPACYQLLPSKTLAYVRVADIQELGERFNETSVGKMFQEEQLQSLTSQLFEEAENAFAPVSEEIGLSLNELLSIPSGEVALALAAPRTGFPAPVLMVDIEGQEANAVRLLEVIQDKIKEEGKLAASTEVIGSTKLQVFSQEEDTRYTGIIFFRRDGMLVITSHMQIAEQIVAAWDGDEEQEVLEQNEDFADTMRHSKGPRGAAPEIRWFVDPVTLAKVALRGNLGAQMGLSMLPAVGLDGLLAIGGSMTFASDEYDTFIQTHIITAEPRTGVLAAIAMKSGTNTPEEWVPHDVSSYITLHWDFDKTKQEVEILYNSFRGDDAFEEQVLARANEALGMDVMEEVVGAMEGRISLATWIPKPTRLNNFAYVGGIHLKEDVDFEATWQKMMEAVPAGEEPEEKSYAGFTIYSAPGEEEEADIEDTGGDSESDIFRPLPVKISVAIVDDCVLIANRPEYLERAIVSRSSSSKLLKDELEFKLVASKARRQPGGRTPAYFSFNRPEEGMRMAYELVTAEKTRESLGNAAENNPFLGRINQALEDNPLPPFAKLREYLAPTGSIMSVDDNGIHYIGFGLRR